MAVTLSWEEAQDMPRLSAYLTMHTVFASPTDTVYGIQAVATAENKTRLASLKKRTNEPFIRLVSSLKMAKSLAQITPEQEKLLRRYWPNAITFILPSVAEKETIALRQPRHAWLLALMDRFGMPLLSTSCNLHGQPVATGAAEAKEYFGEGIDLYIEHAPRSTMSSTLVDLTGEKPRLVRSGVVSLLGD